MFGGGSVLFYLFQAATAAILILAANTAFNGFPGLASILARDRYLPRQLHNRGDRLVFSNGVLLLAAAAVALIVGFDANLDRLIQLYIVGVFTSFTLSQFGMVRHWQRTCTTCRTGRDGTGESVRPRPRGSAGDPPRPGDQRDRGGVHRGGAGRRVRHQGRPTAPGSRSSRWSCSSSRCARSTATTAGSAAEVTAAPGRRTAVTLPSRVHALVLVSRLHKPALRALALARAIRPDVADRPHPRVDDDETRRLRRSGSSRAIPVPLTVLEAPYRDPHPPADRLRQAAPRQPTRGQ